MTQIGRMASLSLLGIDAFAVTVEATILNGLPNFTIVGLADTAVSEAKERLRASFQNTGLTWPNQRITVNLAPADMVKTGAGFDLAIAAALLSALTGKHLSKGLAILGELGLDGSIRKVPGVLATALTCKKLGYTELIVPAANYFEAQLVPNLTIHPMDHLGQLAARFGCKIAQIPPVVLPLNLPAAAQTHAIDMQDVHGQDEAVWALQIAAVGRHHLQLIGPPGVGKSMLAQRFATIMPQLSVSESIELAAIASVCGQKITSLEQVRPFIAPHHSTTLPALIGGGSGVPKPGAITHAHHGVLYCDEFPEFNSRVMQALRQPLEDGYVDLQRARAQVRYPADFQLILAANPCPCGHLYDLQVACTCTGKERSRYASLLQGPLRDRIDITLALRRPHKARLQQSNSFTSQFLRQQIEQAINKSRLRFAKYPELKNCKYNTQIPGKWLREHTSLSRNSQKFLDKQLRSGKISMRGIDRILRLAWSIADLREINAPGDDEIAEAIILRTTKK